MTFTPKATNFQASKVSLHFYTDFKAEISSMQTQIKRKPIISDSISHCCCCCSVAQSCVILQPYGLQHARSPCPSPSPKVCPNSCPLHWWCHPAISSSDVLFSFCPQSFPATGTFPMSQLFALEEEISLPLLLWTGLCHWLTMLTSNHQGIHTVDSYEILWRNIT